MLMKVKVFLKENGLFANEMDIDRAAMGVVAMFPKVDALPCAEAETAILEGDG